MIAANTVDHLAAIYRHHPGTPITSPLFSTFAKHVNRLFDQIPLPVWWVHDKQPFETSGQMRNHAARHGVLLLYSAQSALGDVYNKHRAVHDWFGHIVPGVPFGVDGEMEAYRIHQQQYPRRFHPIIFSDVVLHNAYFESFGTWFPEEKWVLVDDRLVLKTSN